MGYYNIRAGDFFCVKLLLYVVMCEDCFATGSYTPGDY